LTLTISLLLKPESNLSPPIQQWHALKSAIAFTVMAGLMAGIEVGLIMALRVAKTRHLQWPQILMAVLSASLLSAGVLTHYWDIYVHRTVRGISFIFVGIDAAGDVFSLVSVFFQPTLDILGMVIYGSELLLWTGVFICGAYFNLLPWARNRLSRHRAQVETQETCGPHDEGTTATPAIALHNLPSSTSVFQTPGSGHMVRRLSRSLSIRQSYE
jgi:hypothetical protein